MSFIKKLLLVLFFLKFCADTSSCTQLFPMDSIAKSFCNADIWAQIEKKIVNFEQASGQALIIAQDIKKVCFTPDLIHEAKIRKLSVAIAQLMEEKILVSKAIIDIPDEYISLKQRLNICVRKYQEALRILGQVQKFL